MQAVKAMEKSVKRTSQKLMKDDKKDGHFTSVHQAAAHVAISHMKYIVAKNKFLRNRNNNQIDAVGE